MILPSLLIQKQVYRTYKSYHQMHWKQEFYWLPFVRLYIPFSSVGLDCREKINLKLYTCRGETTTAHTAFCNFLEYAFRLPFFNIKNLQKKIKVAIISFCKSSQLLRKHSYLPLQQPLKEYYRITTFEKVAQNSKNCKASPISSGSISIPMTSDKRLPQGSVMISSSSSFSRFMATSAS